IGDQSVPTTGGGEQAAIKLVARADRRLAQEITSWRRESLRVTRDDLSQPFCSGPRGAEERATGLSSIEAHDPSITASGPKWPKTGANQGSRLDPGATGSG